MTPLSPPGPMTGTDQEPVMPASARSAWPARAALARTSGSATGRSVAAAMPTGPPAGPNGSADHPASCPGENPSDAAQISAWSVTRWMHSFSVPSAAPSADRISSMLEEGSAETSRSASRCSRLSWRRAEESTCWPDSSATTSSGWVLRGSRLPTIRPWRITTMRSASRNICSMS